MNADCKSVEWTRRRSILRRFFMRSTDGRVHSRIMVNAGRPNEIIYSDSRFSLADGIGLNHGVLVPGKNAAPVNHGLSPAGSKEPFVH